VELLERAQVLRGLSELLADAAKGDGRLVLLAGEAGIGKTSVVSRFAQLHAADARVLTGACDHLDAPSPLGPLADIARAGGDHDFGRLLTERTGINQISARLLDLLTGRGRPFLVIIEDAHWADASTLDLLRFLGRRITSTRALVLVTYRSDEHADDDPLRVLVGDLATSAGVTSLTLDALTLEAVSQLARGRHHDPAGLHRITGGNPFYVTEVLATAPAVLPRTVNDAIRARLSRLSAQARATVEAAAVIGYEVDHRVLSAVAGAGAAGLDECITKGMLSWAEGRMTFRHELTRAAVLDGIPPARRAELHGRALVALSSDPLDPEALAMLAHHAQKAGDRSATHSYASAAGAHAARLGAHREAAAQYKLALCSVDDPAADLYEAYARECAVTGDIDAAVTAAEAAIEIRTRAGEAIRAADDTRLLASLFWNTQQRPAAVPAAARAVAVLEAHPAGPELAAAYVTLAWLHQQAASAQDAVSWARRASDLAEALGDTAVQARALRIVGAARLCGPAEDGWPELQKALSLAAAADLHEETAAAYDVLVWFGAMHRQFGYCDQLGAAAVAFCAEHDLTVHELSVLRSRCVELVHKGRWDEADRLAADLLGRSPQSQADRIESLYLLGRVRARRGEPAWEALDEALAIADPRGELQHVGNVRAVRAEAAWLEGRPDASAAEASAAYDLAIAVQDPWILGELALWRWRGAALDSLPAVVRPHPYGLQILGDWAAAAAEWQRLGCPFEQAAALLDADEEPALRAALAIFTGLGAQPAAAMAARKLHRLGARDIPRGPQATTRRNPLGLTRREAEVLELLCTGRTDPQIASELFLSAKTVSNHVGAILAKLGVSSRREAASLLMSQVGRQSEQPGRPQEIIR
jgi:DNA-binding CsgD family transcriptional regulator/tetratricopeptide (TPR) repeat protein